MIISDDFKLICFLFILNLKATLNHGNWVSPDFWPNAKVPTFPPTAPWIQSSNLSTTFCPPSSKRFIAFFQINIFTLEGMRSISLVGKFPIYFVSFGLAAAKWEKDFRREIVKESTRSVLLKLRFCNFSDELFRKMLNLSEIEKKWKISAMFTNSYCVSTKKFMSK